MSRPLMVKSDGEDGLAIYSLILLKVNSYIYTLTHLLFEIKMLEI